MLSGKQDKFIQAHSAQPRLLGIVGFTGLQVVCLSLWCLQPRLFGPWTYLRCFSSPRVAADMLHHWGMIFQPKHGVEHVGSIRYYFCF